MSLRRLAALAALVVILLAAGWSAWLLWSVDRGVATATADAHALKTAAESRDEARITTAVADLRTSADDVAATTGGRWWGLLTHLPVVGDDLAGVRTMTQTLSDLSHHGVPELAGLVPTLHGLVKDGRIDLTRLEAAAAPVATGATRFRAAADRLDAVDSAGFLGQVRTKFDDARAQIDDLARALQAADSATSVLPQALGSKGPRNYLLVFENNAEIRATGGLPGSWAVVHAQGGRLTITKQGAGGPLVADQPVVPLTTTERTLYDVQLGTYFVDANFTAEFPRAAEIWRAWLDRQGVRVDGVVGLDTWGLAHLMQATGPIDVDGVQLTADNVVEQLLSTTYARIPQPPLQDVFFQHVARAVFSAVTSPGTDPVKLAGALADAIANGRIEANVNDRAVQRTIAGSRLAGLRPGLVGNRPQVDITLNDASGAKMSYYLRTAAKVESVVCRAGTQTLSASLTLHAAIDAKVAQRLPTYVKGTGEFGTDPGSQLVIIRLFSPDRGVLTDVKLQGRPYLVDPQTRDHGRHAGEVVVFLAPGAGATITWTMITGPDQGGPVDVHLTPGMEDRLNDWSVPSSCR